MLTNCRNFSKRFAGLNTDEAAKIKEELKNSQNSPVLRGPAPPLTSVYIDKVVSQVGTSNQVTEDIGMQQTSHAVSGTVTVAVMEVGYGSENQWLDDERLHIKIVIINLMKLL
ncbi:DUF4879 domain-containing protein [Lysinibacillus fusiformis]|uniref:DUF4879 domain-containing protein n=1 Tax=Lysinibacillus fusiformis TaxID=28031 RepID=UPI002E209AC5